YYYLDSTPTHTYLKALHKYPHAAYPYERLLEENRRRGKDQAEFELVDTGVFDADRYFDVGIEYAKASPDDVLVRISVANRGDERAAIHVLPTLWFRNTWDWGRSGETFPPKPELSRVGSLEIRAEHATLGVYRLTADRGPGTAVRRGIRPDVRRAHPRGGPLPHGDHSSGRDDRGACRAPAGAGRSPLVEAALLLRHPRLARGRPRSASAPGIAGVGAQRRLDALEQPRHPLDAGQMGVPVVRRVGP